MPAISLFQKLKGALLTLDTDLGRRLKRAMPRTLRIEYPGAIYHVMNRGDRREPIFRDDLDRRRFLGTLAEVCTKTDWPREIGFNISSKIGRSHGVNKSMRIASDETFRQELLERVQAGAGEPQRADVRRETVEEKAQRILREELGDGVALAQRPRGTRGKCGGRAGCEPKPA
jgi:hypothetical protein